MPSRPSSAEGFATGKLILCGEHAVVYGHPAIAFAVERGTRVRLSPRPGPHALPSNDPRLCRAMDALLGPEGFAVDIASDLPIGKGMGSSAALAVATLRAVHRLRATPASPQALFDAAMVAERVFHGNPSGLDVAAAIHGGLLGFTRQGGPQPLPSRPDWTVVVMDSGTQGNTAALVAGVAERRSASGEVQVALHRIGALVTEAEAALDDPAVLGPLLTENHALLRSIGVSTPKLDELVTLALNHGAWGAKLAGAGGGGVAIALTDDPSALLSACDARAIPAFATQVQSPPECA